MHGANASNISILIAWSLCSFMDVIFERKSMFSEDPDYCRFWIALNQPPELAFTLLLLQSFLTINLLMLLAQEEEHLDEAPEEGNSTWDSSALCN